MTLSGLSLRDLEYAIAVADLGSFGKAAERCRVAQPSLSVQVGKLEARLKTVLFERTTRRVIVTPQGQELIGQMRRVVGEAGRLLELSVRSGEAFGGTLRLSAIATLGPYYFPRILQSLRAHYPALALVLGEGRTGDLVTALLRGDLDAVLMSTPTGEPALCEIPLFHEPFVMACPEGHAATLSGAAGWQGLSAHERLLLEEGHCLRDQAIAACAEIDTSSRHATSLETLKYMVAAGEGCTLLPVLAESEVHGLRYLPLRGSEYARTIVLAWRRSDPRIQEFEQLGATLRRFQHPAIQTFA
ncbi:LysR family hydrogen peroxide-inducible transcriptional activator [Phyllobacterium myrsinacearum]|uniref:LysR substrate-binding domain-containing protein n=1 Tax=Phyllobacterium myrsinacearum TaxID=28101 RepID=UPI00102A18D3|nr:LysR substrate-binding domain-containing protein [Phyllobacterium myrsinacearum]RZS88851.1 LysR family hydrogen peroxide-inducible transcriptional activator [Phyllobacterium myrsinacearum]